MKGNSQHPFSLRPLWWLGQAALIVLGCFFLAFGVQLLCTRATGQGEIERYATSWASLPTLEVEQQVLGDCPAPCTPVIQLTADAHGCVQGTANGRWDQPAKAIAELAADLGLGDLSLIEGDARIRVATDGESARDQENFDKVSVVEQSAYGAIATVEASGLIDADAAWLQAPQASYAFAAATFGYQLIFDVPASCQGVPAHNAQLTSLEKPWQEGGVAMERWEDP